MQLQILVENRVEVLRFHNRIVAFKQKKAGQTMQKLCLLLEENEIIYQFII